MFHSTVLFHSTGPYYCPDCPPEWVGKAGDRRGDPPLVLTVRNYSGTGADVARCPRCNRRYSVSYKVDAIERMP